MKNEFNVGDYVKIIPNSIYGNKHYCGCAYMTYEEFFSENGYKEYQKKYLYDIDIPAGIYKIVGFGTHSSNHIIYIIENQDGGVHLLSNENNEMQLYKKANAKKTIFVKYPNNEKEYSFISNLDLKVGDLVVTDNSTGYGIATVTRIDDKLSLTATKWIVSKIDIEAFENNLEKDKFNEQITIISEFNENLNNFRKYLMNNKEKNLEININLLFEIRRLDKMIRSVYEKINK